MITRALPAANPAPPWGTVLASTIRLRARQRFWPATTRWRVISALILAAVLFCGGAVTVALGRGAIAGKGAAGNGDGTSGRRTADAGDRDRGRGSGPDRGRGVDGPAGRPGRYRRL